MGIGRRLPHDEAVERGAEGVDVRSGRELRHAALAVLLHGGIAARLSDGRRRGLLARLGVVLLREAEVDEHGAAVTAEHDVTGLDVEVVDVALVDVGHGIGHLTDVAHSVGLGEAAAMVLHHVLERAALGVLHDVVGRAVLLEDVVDGHDAGVMQLGYGARLLDELLAEAYHELPLPLTGHGDGGRSVVARADVLHEELLDGHAAVQACLHSLVGDAEAALPQHALYPILASLQEGTL